MFWILVAVLVVLVFIIYRKNKKDEEYWKHIMAIPGPKAYPIIGTEYHLDTPEEVFERDRSISREYYPIHRRYALDNAIVTLLLPEDIELVVTNVNHNEKNRFYTLLQDWLGSGLITSKGEKWHKRRKLLTPAFHFSILQEFMGIFNKETNILVKDLKKLCNQPYIDVVKPITEFTLYSIGETSLGKDLREDPKCDEYKQAVYDFGEHVIYRRIRPWLHRSFIFNLSSVGRESAKNVKKLHSFSDNIIKERYKLFEQNGKLSYSDRKRMALLDLMMKAKYNGADIDDRGIREEADTFIFAGHDTTAVSICTILMLMANEQEIQEEMYQEIMSVPENPSFAEASELKYMERCIKESLRLFATVPQIGRKAGEEIKTKSGYTIPKGCFVNIGIYNLHRSPEIYENPEKFDPDRFLPENIAKRHPYAYIPFSAGSRNCIGQKYAMLEMKAALCGILRNFKLESVTKPEDMKFKADIILRPACEIKIKFVPRN